MSSSQKPPSIPPRKKSGSDDTTSTPSTAPRTGAAARGAAVKATGSTGTTTKDTTTKDASKGAGTEAPKTAASSPAPAAAAATSSPSETSAISLTPAKERPAKERPSKAPKAVGSESGPRRVRLAVSRIDPWSVMKLSFLVSFAIGIMLVVAVSAIWLALNGMHVFSSINDLVTEILADSNFDLLDYVAYDRVISATALISIVNVFLITALSTIGAFIYNISAALVGGVHLTMTDD